MGSFGQAISSEGLLRAVALEVYYVQRVFNLSLSRALFNLVFLSWYIVRITIDKFYNCK